MRNDLRARAVAFRLAMSLARRGERERSEVSALQEWRSDANSAARAAMRNRPHAGNASMLTEGGRADALCSARSSGDFPSRNEPGKERRERTKGGECTAEAAE